MKKGRGCCSGLEEKSFMRVGTVASLQFYVIVSSHQTASSILCSVVVVGHASRVLLPFVVCCR